MGVFPGGSAGGTGPFPISSTPGDPIVDKKLMHVAVKIFKAVTQMAGTVSCGRRSKNMALIAERIEDAAHRIVVLGNHLATGVSRSRYNLAVARLQRHLRELSAEASTLRPYIDGMEPIKTLPTLKFIYDDLVAMQEAGTRFGWKEGRFFFHTRYITLQDEDGCDVDLGDMRVEVAFTPELDPDRDITVSPLEPNYGPKRYFHPHVQATHRTICLGDGHAPARYALRDGRIMDLVEVVTRVLHTYNEDSPYVHLNEWGGTECDGCGSMHPDHDLESCHAGECDKGNVCGDCRTWCEQCDQPVCNDCSRSCSQCGRGICTDCAVRCHECRSALCSKHVKKCHQCGEEFCEDCLHACETCSQEFCDSCLPDKTCSDCQTQEEAEENDDESENESEGVCEAPVASGAQ